MLKTSKRNAGYGLLVGLGVSLSGLSFSMEQELLKGEEDFQRPSLCQPSSPDLFSVGFEFQEKNNLVAWAERDYSVIKKPIFRCMNEDKEELWHVVIDNKDIEFVIKHVPIPSGRKKMIEAFETMLIAARTLGPQDLENLETTIKQSRIFEKSPLNLKNKLALALEYAASFSLKEYEWLYQKKDRVTQVISNLTLRDGTKEEIDEGTIRSVLSAFLNRKSVSKISFKDWLCSLEEKGLRIQPKEAVLNLVSQKEITVRKAQFIPQMTLGLGLNKVIPITEFFFKGTSYLESENNHTGAFKARQVSKFKYLNDIENNPYIQGFMFLHLLTLKNMLPPLGFEIDGHFVQPLLGLRDQLLEQGQADAKVLIHLLSRRPYSDMWKEIKEHTPYIDLVGENIKEFENITFSNYLEEIIDAEGRKVSLEHLKSYLKKDFYEAQATGDFFSTENVADFFLQKSCLPNLLVKRLGEQAFDSTETKAKINDMKYVFNSVDNPDHTFRYSIGDKKIVELKSQYDWLSPPPLLDEEDAMGYYNADRIHPDREFLRGKAIVEFRMIKNCFMNKDYPLFLQELEGLQEQAIELIDVIEKEVLKPTKNKQESKQ